MPIATLIGPDAYPATLEEARDHLRVDGSDDDAAIGRALAAATAACERHCQARFIRQTLRWTTEASTCIELPLRPVESVDIVGIITPTGEALLSSSDVDLIGVAGRITAIRPASGRSWPAPAAIPYPVTVTFTVGWLAAEVPGDVKAAVLMATARFYEDRQGGGGLTDTIRSLLMGIAP